MNKTQKHREIWRSGDRVNNELTEPAHQLISRILFLSRLHRFQMHPSTPVITFPPLLTRSPDHPITRSPDLRISRSPDGFNRSLSPSLIPKSNTAPPEAAADSPFNPFDCIVLDTIRRWNALCWITPEIENGYST